MRTATVSVTVVLITVFVALATPVKSGEAASRVPVLLELFTSEGCSSCPPADRLLESFDKTQPIASANLIVLSEHVDYWDHLGWKDPWSSASLTARQSDYGRKLRVEEVYTPQLVVDGQFEVVGSDAGAAKTAIAKAVRNAKTDVMLSAGAATGNQISVHLAVAPIATLGKSATVFIALAERQTQSSVLRGENSGRSLSHVDVVRSLTPVGTVSAGSAFAKDFSLSVPKGMGRPLRIVAFVQDEATGHVLGAAQQEQ